LEPEALKILSAAQVRMTFPGGDQKTIALEDVVLTVPIGDDTFLAKQ
jgi:hypothetical protein